ncbi:MAG: hypothetical protein Q7J78_07120 [Clostridiales bacterium]|nr:hypothetical protein [Clostridiales bacterium]
MQELRFRQVPLDFHTLEAISISGSDGIPMHNVEHQHYGCF